LVKSSYIDRPVLRSLARYVGIIPIPYQGPRALKAAIAAVQAALDRGEVVLIFPEAQLTRNGLLGPFYRGLEVMMKGRADVPVVPVYLGQVWGSLFSHSGGRFFRKRPQGWRRRVVVVFGPPVPPPITAFEIRQVGQKPGATGQAPPGVALRVVDDAGQPLPAEAEGWIQALLPGRAGWIETDRRGWLDRDGFLRHSDTDAPM
jgi:hypothetical protein